MPGKIDCYIDCTSIYSLFALAHLRRLRPVLSGHSVTLDFHPVFLGGINQGSGNQPPWKLPAKAAYGEFDRKRACRHYGIPIRPIPSHFPILSVVPMRAMIWIKENCDQEAFEGCFEELFKCSFLEGVDVSKPDGLKRALGRRLAGNMVQSAMEAASLEEYKAKLKETTRKCVEDFGAFGCPWHMVTNSEGKTEPFFGSDRYHFMWGFLGIPFENVKVLDAHQSKL